MKQPIGNTDGKSAAAQGGSAGAVERLQVFLHWHLVPGVVHAARRLKNRMQGNYTSATIPVEWPASPTRIDLLRAVVDRRQVQSYLEIGCRDDECFSQIHAPHRVGVDPAEGGTVRATSDEFFARNSDRFDLIFIDGLHVYEQVVRDIRNSVAALNPGGVIVLHDCLPTDCVAQYREQASRIWNGDVWKAIVDARTWPDVDTVTCLIDHGVGIIRARPNPDPLTLPGGTAATLRYEDLAADWQRLLRTVDYPAGVEFACGDATA
jgi:hypothetical protein